MAALKNLERQLHRLRWRRWGVAIGAALCALAIAAIGALLFLAAVDILFELPTNQRLAAIAIVTLVSGWLVASRVRAGLRWPEPPEELALLVEKNHKLDSDLIAALQFQAAEHEPALGSPTLQHAVIERARRLSDELDFFAGETAKPLPARAWLLTGAVLVSVVLASSFPEHASVFWRRLQLSSDHYPTQSKIVGVLANGRVLLDAGDKTMTPATVKIAEGEAVELLVQCKGVQPERGTAWLQAMGQEAELPLAKLTVRERLYRLRRGRELLDDLHASPAAVSAWLAADAPKLAAELREPQPPLARAKTTLDQLLADGENSLATDVSWYAAELPRHGNKVTYRLELGDAWTEPAAIAMIPLPTVALEITADSPAYSKLGRVKMSPGARQLRVLEGSTVDLSLACLNQKQLRRVWADLLADGKDTQRVSLACQSGRWTLPVEGTPLANLQQRVQFAVQVEDEDGLQLPTPLSGQIQTRPDRPPSGTATVLHRVVLPDAKPTIALMVADDFGIQSIQLRLLVEKPSAAVEAIEPGVSRSENSPPANTAANPANGPAGDNQRVAPIPLVAAESLPWRIDYPLDLAPLQLAKGDRLKITLEVTDERGASPGQQRQAAPLVLEISDEAGVLAAVSESDKQSERELNELIKQQLGIGEAP